MTEKTYRLEKIEKNGHIRYNIIKDVQFKDKKTKVRKRIENPNVFIDYDFVLESKAISKKAELVYDYYTHDYLEKSDFLSLEEKRWKYTEFFKRASVDEISSYEKRFEWEYIHGTTAVEGNTLRLNEVADLLEYEILPQKELREINEIQNYKKVRPFVNGHRGKLTVSFIKKIHSLIMDHVLETPGVFRRTGLISISGYDLPLAPPDLIENELEELIQKFYENIRTKKNPFEQIMCFHYEFEMIHPFLDGNGRVGRELLNYLLTKEGYPRFLIRIENREEYLSALRFGNKQNYEKMVQTFSRMYQKQLEKIEAKFSRLK
jgi:Fic family protein